VKGQEETNPPEPNTLHDNSDSRSESKAVKDPQTQAGNKR